MFPITQICQTSTGEAIDLKISLPEELATLAFAVNRGELSGRTDVTVRLTADIDLTGFRWVPIGFGDSEFAGVFDGCGHTVRNMTIKKDYPGSYGLFGFCTGIIENLTVIGSITCVAGDAHSAVGGIAGLVDGGQINNCTADISIDSQKRSLGMYAGGVVGQLREGAICDCRSSTRFENVLGNFIYLGGVVGAAENAKITHCVFDGSIQILGDTGYYIDAGSIVGNVRGRITVSDCLNRGAVDASDFDCGFLTLGDIVGRWEGEGAELQPGSRATLRRTASSMAKEEL